MSPQDDGHGTTNNEKTVCKLCYAEKMEGRLRTPPFDPRFPNTNQASNCWQNFADFRRCQTVKGDDFEPCKYFIWAARHICPDIMFAKFQEQRDEGRFPERKC